MTLPNYGNPIVFAFDTNNDVYSLQGPGGKTVPFMQFSKDSLGNVTGLVGPGGSTIAIGKVAPYTGLVATKCGPPQSTNVAYQQLQGRTRHVAMDNLKSIQLVYSGWYVTNPRGNSNVSEVNSSAASTITASIEYPIGTIKQVTFANVAAGTLAPGGTLISDFVSVNIPIGAAFFVRVYQTNPTAILFIATGSSAAFGESCSIAASGLPDLTMGGTIASNNPQVRFTPSAIIGMTTRASIAICGDSKAAGALDTYSDGYMLVGEIERSVGKTFAFTNLSNGGERINDVATGQAAKRIPLIAYASHVICQYGINDLTMPRTAAQILADIATFKSLLPSSKPFIQGTVAPGSTSTDAWATTINQTTFTSNPARITLNASIRTCLAGAIDGYVEISDAVESVRDSGLWKAPGYTVDGIHEIQAAAIIVQTYGGVTDALRLIA